MKTWQGKWAVVTGASAGIGRAFCSELAAGGSNLVLVARRRDRLSELAAMLSSKHSIKTEICPADLAQPSGSEEIFAFTQGKGIDVDLLINNAGFDAKANSVLEIVLHGSDHPDGLHEATLQLIPLLSHLPSRYCFRMAR